MKTIVAFLLLLCSTLWAQAQQCNGSLGDPIRNETFEAGAGTFGNSRNELTNYRYVAGTPNDGEYTIANSTSTMYNSWWHTTDHTGNSGGYMMIVNASNDPGIFYRQTIPDLCAGTTYEFAAWVLNLSNRNEIKPDIKFSIETSAGTFALPTGPIDANTQQVDWKRYPVLFTMPASGGDITLIMSNNAPGGIGNDIALDDITFRPCGPMLTTSFGATGSSVVQSNGCAGTSQSYTLNAQATTGYSNPAYQWQTSYNNGPWTDIIGATTTTYTKAFAQAVAGNYRYRLASAEAGNIASTQCRVVSNAINLDINQPPSDHIDANRNVCEGDPIALSASPGDTYSWTGPNGFTSALQSPTIPSATLANAGTYYVEVTRLSCVTPAHTDVAVNPAAIAITGPPATICSGASTTLQATGGTTYRWSPATGLSDPTSPTPEAKPQVSTTYTVTVTNAYNCTATATQTVNVIPAPTADAGANQRITEGQSVTLQGTVTGSNISYYWTPSDFLSNPNVLNPVASPKSDITYILHVVSNDACGIAQAPVFVKVYKSVTVPNTFTPNNDGINDTWNIEALDTYPESTTQVFNRYGEVVMESKGYSKAWDGTTNGKPLPAGTYYYRIDLKNGKVLSGWVGIVR